MAMRYWQEISITLLPLPEYFQNYLPFQKINHNLLGANRNTQSVFNNLTERNRLTLEINKNNYNFFINQMLFTISTFNKKPAFD